MSKLRTLTEIVLALLILCGISQAQDVPAATVTVRYRGVQFNYAPEVFGAVLPGYDPGTVYQSDAPYFANVAPHIYFQFIRADPARPDVNWTGELRVYRIAELATYAEPSYREVVEQLKHLDLNSLTASASATDRKFMLPFMPVLNAAQVFRAQPGAVDCYASRGVEYYAYYSQGIEPIVEGQIMYAYQGITADGAYYLSFSMPVQTGLLPATYPENVDMDTLAANYPQYIQDTFTAINTADTAAFSPSSLVLTRFVDSISVSDETTNTLPLLPQGDPE